ncbi:MAG TPA: hypothetical protein VL404_09805 [Candidatus Eisenbacteria bacterium]|nr:hypothetical protein [Candidatus Eisenbacteria bacterium]
MFNSIFGTFWILLGALWVWKPEILRGWFVRKMNRKAMWTAWGVIFFMGLHLASLAGKIQTPALRKAAFAGILVLAALLWIAQSRARLKAAAWFQKTPAAAFRLFGWINIATGLSMILAARGGR